MQTADDATLKKILPGLTQGDLISLGAVALVGLGRSHAWDSSTAHSGRTGQPPDEVWSLTIESDIGWYVVISQPCDIIRNSITEPCIVVCPLRYVPVDRWVQLCNGPTSPREFPFPQYKALPQRKDERPVADLRFVTSVDKGALLHPSVEKLRPLSGPQRERFSRWVGARYARVPHPDELEERVLPKAAQIIRKLAVQFSKGNGDPEARLVAATETWYLAGNNKRVIFTPMVSDASIKAARLPALPAPGEPLAQEMELAIRKLESRLRAALPPKAGYTCEVRACTLDGVSGADLLEWSEWVIDTPPDPLS